MLGYIAGGVALARGACGRRERVGIGLGIAGQGLFLLCYDSVFAWCTTGWLLKD